MTVIYFRWLLCIKEILNTLDQKSKIYKSNFGHQRKYAWTILRASKKSSLHTFLSKFGLQISIISYLRAVGWTRNKTTFCWDVNCCTLQCAMQSKNLLGRDCTIALHSVQCMCMKTLLLATHLSGRKISQLWRVDF